jgi:hypothetical protein
MSHQFTRRQAVIAGLGTALSLPAAAMAARRPSAPVSNAPVQMPRAPANADAGFRPIFDGRTLAGWDGDPRYWRVEGGAIVGEVTPDRILRSNTFLYWTGGKPADFELKVECRISAAGNSGINYRSILVEDEIEPANRFAMQGLQFDMDGKNNYTAMVYEERGRRFIAPRGQFTRVATGQAERIGTIGSAAQLRAAILPDWNEFHIIARGPQIYHLVNGQLMAAALDEWPARRKSGLIGMQVHVGPPAKVEFRNIRLKLLA